MSNKREEYTIEEHPVMRKYVFYYKKLKQYKLYYCYLAETIKFSLLTAPFYTIAVSRQLSVSPHKEIYGDYVSPSDSKQLMKLSNELTLKEAKKYELIKFSGVPEGQKPYRAPVYDNYFQTIKGLYNQGILGFYKGNGWRIITSMTSQRIRISLEWFLREKYDYFNKWNFFRDWLVMSICDIALHPGFVLETRYILQNRIPQFQIYSSAFKFKSRSSDDFFVCFHGHIPKNFFYLLGFYLYYLTPTTSNLSFAIIMGNTFSYPIMTAFRRMVCQSTQMPGLIPLRYLNLTHAIFLIRREEGFFRGLYKGFTAHLIGTIIYAFLVPLFAQFNYYKNKFEEDENFFTNDPIFEEIKKRKLENLRNM